MAPTHRPVTGAERGPEAQDASAGLAQGGLGGDEDELLEAGQEEVFSRSEVERGAVEHHTGEEPGDASAASERQG
ncbi:hypothetical protein [Brevundimonas sp. SORGH_AS_0993]|uniref:hypothetical protein n=1 Tax=Brevundimonas sp. SORGH_AS_0993 TaxID=3041794 RepID=UPI00278198AD|nr:hypothetical protein [Brevundimonas sp. SORGH_AS_0993]MDQ1154187.1 hypothetical protein [Brevundimonas sp. SORGH_AS_0993]